MYVTILTPTYNRAGKIVDLYESLCRQTCKDFKWLVIDDGSMDNTKVFFDEIKEKTDFEIEYIYKENGGKHTALNEGIQIIETELTFIVDSDDFLVPDAIEIIISYHKKYQLDDSLCGYSFLRKFPDGKINGKKFEPNEKIGTYIEIRVNDNDTQSDKAEVFKTRCLKEYPFPVFEKEKFLGEDIVWTRMARKYKMVHINEAIYVGMYQTDGLTHNRRKNNIKSPLGCMNRAKEFTKRDIDFRYRLKGTLQIIAYGSFAKKKCSEIIKFSEAKWLTIIMFIPGKLLYLLWKMDYEKGK